MSRPVGSKNKKTLQKQAEQIQSEEKKSAINDTPNKEEADDASPSLSTPTPVSEDSLKPTQQLSTILPPIPIQELNIPTSIPEIQLPENTDQKKPSFIQRIWIKLTLRRLRLKIAQTKTQKSLQELEKQRPKIIKTITDLQDSFYITYPKKNEEDEEIEVNKEGLELAPIQDLISILEDMCLNLETIINEPK